LHALCLFIVFKLEDNLLVSVVKIIIQWPNFFGQANTGQYSNNVFSYNILATHVVGSGTHLRVATHSLRSPDLDTIP